MNVPAPEFLTDEQQVRYRRRGGFHIRPDTLRLLNTATGEPCFPPYRLYPIFYQELIFMSESTITHSANGVTCTIEMTADEYLVSTEPMLRMAALSKWATFPRGVSFAVSAVAFFLLVSYVTEISALCTSPGYGPQYAVVFGVVCLLLLHVFLLSPFSSSCHKMETPPLLRRGCSVQANRHVLQRQLHSLHISASTCR